jgi:hypothetical protein
MTATILGFPGVDPTDLGERPDPRNQTILLHKRRDVFVLTIEPAGFVFPFSFSTATRARSHAGEMCQNFPRIFCGVEDRTRSTRASLGEIMAGVANRAGDAA